MSELLCIPLKLTGDVDLVKPLKSVISASRSVNHVDNNSLTELQNLRNKIVASIKNKDYTEQALEDTQNYFDQISNLESKIPFSATKIYFKWLDAFDKGSWFGGSAPYTMSTNLLYEKACILFNVAALCTQVGSKQDLTVEEGMKKAVKMFQMAAGILAAVSTPPPSSPSEQKPTPDLSPESAQALSCLCVAQAQEVILMKAIQDGKKEGIVAKLAKHTHNLYSETGTLLQKDNVKAMWDANWATTISSKEQLYGGLAHLHVGLLDKAESRFGQAIARLQLAENLLSKVQGAGATKWQELCSIALKEVRKDNDLIYFEKVPKSEELGAIDGAAVAKPTPLQSQFLPGGRNLFAEMAVVDGSAKKTECVIS